MSDDIQATENASPEIQAILNELETENKVPEVQKEPEAPVVEEKPPVEEVKPPVVERASKFVPVSKHNEERHKRQEAEAMRDAAKQEAESLRAQLAAANTKPDEQKENKVKSIATRLAEKHGLEPDFVEDFATEMANLAGERAVLPKDLEAKLAAFEKVQQEANAHAEEIQQEKAFDAEFSEVLKEFPDLADQKEEIKQLAFSEDNVNTKLRLLALAYQHDNAKTPGRKTMESPTSVRSSAKVIDYKEMTTEQLADLDGAEFDKYAEWLRKNPRG